MLTVLICISTHKQIFTDKLNKAGNAERICQPLSTLVGRYGAGRIVALANNKRTDNQWSGYHSQSKRKLASLINGTAIRIGTQ